MSSRSEKALKSQKEKHHSILRELVQEVTNKTCADCLAKGLLCLLFNLKRTFNSWIRFLWYAFF